jgi:hypothetical protein
MSQNAELYAYMAAGGIVTPAVAFKLCGSLACHSRMAELRSHGHRIECRKVREGKRTWGEYRLVSK